MPPSLLRDPSGGNAELDRCCGLDEVQVLWVIRRVVHGLPLDDAAVSEQVR
jgi:hypothetical protein